LDGDSNVGQTGTETQRDLEKENHGETIRALEAAHASSTLPVHLITVTVLNFVFSLCLRGTFLRLRKRDL
jgi:hypothetical protein